MQYFASALLLALLISMGCGSPPDAQDLHQCHADLDLQELVKKAGPPDPGTAWGVTSGTERVDNQLVDRQSATSLTLQDPTSFMADLCSLLHEQLETRCEVAEYWSGPGYCAATTRSRPEDTVDEKGRYLRRPSEGRVTLFASPLADQRTNIVLASTEWQD